MNSRLSSSTLSRSAQMPLAQTKWLIHARTKEPAILASQWRRQKGSPQSAQAWHQNGIQNSWTADKHHSTWMPVAHLNWLKHHMSEPLHSQHQIRDTATGLEVHNLSIKVALRLHGQLAQIMPPEQ